MIRLQQITTKHGETILRFRYDHDGYIRHVEFDRRDVDRRLGQLREILGREPTENEWRDVLKALIAQVREGLDPFEAGFDYEAILDVDLEAEP